MPFRLGFHASSAGTLEKTAIGAAALGANAYQIFSSSPRMWHAPPPDKSQAILLERARTQLDLTPLVIHANYLINLCSADSAIRMKSIAAFRGEIDRAIVLGAEYLVVHPGSAKDLAMEEAIRLGAEGLIEAAKGRTQSDRRGRDCRRPTRSPAAGSRRAGRASGRCRRCRRWSLRSEF